MAKRHALRPSDISSIVERLQELVMAHSGEDAFDEIFKMLVAKIFCEVHQLDSPVFRGAGSSEKLKLEFNRLLAEALKTWPGILDRSYEIKLKAEHLGTCLDVFNGVNICGADFEALDHAFEFLVSNASKGAKGQYFTPRHVIECCIRIIDPQPHELIFDPACGSGGFLFHALRHIKTSHPEINLPEYAKNKVWGTDFDAKATKTAKALLILAGAPEANIYRVNSLLKPIGQPELGDPLLKQAPLNLEDTLAALIPRFKGFDIIVTNPPFAGEIAEKETLEGYELAKGNRRTERDVLFIERCIQLLKPGGRLAIVVPHNKVGALSFAHVREWLMKKSRVISVIGLARETFLPHTHQKTSIIVCQKRRDALSKVTNDPILFQVSTRSGKDAKGKLVTRNPDQHLCSHWDRIDHDFAEVVESFHQFKTTQNIDW
ncbi:MAG: N-6 DNA methylase [Luteolibacter sp.]